MFRQYFRKLLYIVVGSTSVKSNKRQMVEALNSAWTLCKVICVRKQKNKQYIYGSLILFMGRLKLLQDNMEVYLCKPTPENSTFLYYQFVIAETFRQKSVLW